MFEPIGGSAPKYTGQGVVNPLAAIYSVKMMLDHLGLENAAASIDQAIAKAIVEEIKDLGAGRMGMSTSDVGDLVVRNMEG